MHTYLLIFGLFTAILFFLIDKNLLPGTIIARKTILNKLRNNKKRELQLYKELEELVSAHQAWSFTAFPDSDITYAEYLELLKEKSDLEYSEYEFEKVRSGELNKKQLSDYIYMIENQEEAVAALEADIDFQKTNFRLHSNIATAC